jgi:AraC-like DNA-binding protein
LLTISYKLYRGDVRVCFEEVYPVEDIQRPLLEAVVLSVKNVLDTITLGTCPVREVSFPFKTPAYASLARDMFRAEVRYGQSWTGFAFPKELLDAPLKLADLEAFRQAELICQQELSKLSSEPSIAGRVHRLLLEKQNGFPALPTVARQFHLTPRTLHRRLEAEGTSFRDVLEEVRHTLAVEHLKSGQSTIEEIAFLLGYSDLANFRRAFKRWERTTPSAFRRRFSKP